VHRARVQLGKPAISLAINAEEELEKRNGKEGRQDRRSLGVSASSRDRGIRRSFFGAPKVELASPLPNLTGLERITWFRKGQQMGCWSVAISDFPHLVPVRLARGRPATPSRRTTQLYPPADHPPP